MATLLDLRRRIKSVKNTEQITKAMKTVSTAKFKKAQRGLFEGRPLWHAAPDLLARISRWAGARAHPLFAVRAEKTIHVIVITSDKGLCGAFNSNLLSRTLEFAEAKSGSCRVRLALAGRKAAHFFKKYPFPVDWAYIGKVDKLGPADIGQLARLVTRLYAFMETDGVYIAYNEFKSVLAPRISIAKVLPIVPDPGVPAPPEAGAPDWEPAGTVLFESLVPRYVEDQISHAFFESRAAEQAARMMAMDNASKNAEELIGGLVLVLNKIRQAEITGELLEIMTAVEALKK
ncbi:MAG: ATP synthase F1 subunit gamma [Candidatus Aminicenantales bacterium]